MVAACDPHRGGLKMDPSRAEMMNLDVKPQDIVAFVTMAGEIHRNDNPLYSWPGAGSRLRFVGPDGKVVIAHSLEEENALNYFWLSHAQLYSMVHENGDSAFSRRLEALEGYARQHGLPQHEHALFRGVEFHY